ncbi:hypothetical protein K0017_05075 [Staphylococcus massiliensis]|uniref:hypothetical protein n=1 Tax=Staphylococcus massiliensis TaxID=555791 RepID=UPI001EDE930B|nr:hypothetical protein [Staphylococcus massiliensis]MCG3401691.1 hypothetical protein [Staphylococcus massiliensis]
MSVEIENFHQMMNQIRSKYGEAQLQTAQDKALRAGSSYFVSVMKRNFQVFRDTGASIGEITVTEPHYIHGNVRMVKVHWKGPMNRYAIIHINEYGSVKNPTPRGKGAIARTMYTTEQPYKQIIKKSLEGDL